MKNKTTALILSIFAGELGIDRFYLGYIGIGLLKLFTVGCFGILWLIDIIQIATGNLQPADGGGYLDEISNRNIQSNQLNQMTNQQQFFFTCKNPYPNLIQESDNNMSERMIKVCANCKNTYIEGDKYCRYCGAPMGKPDYIEEYFEEIYGPPPMTRVHKCANCGYSWETVLMDDSEKWCPKCGNSAPIQSEEKWL